jgi:hypothetical protein
MLLDESREQQIKLQQSAPALPANASGLAHAATPGPLLTCSIGIISTV